MVSTAYIGIGSNLGNPTVNCKDAITALDALPETAVTQRSSFYKSEPIGIKEQSWFINTVVEIETNFSPEELLVILLKIEYKMGRVRLKRWGPRIIDLDLLFYENLILKKPALEIPHPQITNRSFVLIPMAEIRSDYIHPILKLTIAELVDAIPQKTATNRLVSFD